VEIGRSVGGIESRQELIGVAHAFAERIGIRSAEGWITQFR